MLDNVEVNGRTRTFTVVLPEQPSSVLVLVFHGSKQTGPKHREFTGRQYDTLTAQGATVAYLDGYRGNWNDARRESFFPARTENIDDVAFARAVAGRLGAKKVFAVGYSNGGQMVMRLIHEAPDLISGAVVIGATMPTPESFLVPDPAPAPVPMPVVLIAGTQDPIVAYHGGGLKWWARKVFKVGGQALSMPRSAGYYAARNGITQPPTTTTLPANESTSSVERTDFRDGERPPVVLFTIHGGGHTVPGPKRAPGILGKTNRDIRVADLVSELLLSHE
ncbi:alpha/beta hydrolase [Kineosporia sp. NBRC 101731]|uniref:alpha/beta hydrolase family esterase n=1 Tax=Kineosporia sp. NBRC 101731 TaxID=3032199 RepID=UPI0024A54388|nr:alpha/beta hydrolase [Kineosporia sp. NBRC 101731]GLY27250.1 hypothetical protein Kisp02_06150 [Kineosporia sp. NBRC 101731]